MRYFVIFLLAISVSSSCKDKGKKVVVVKKTENLVSAKTLEDILYDMQLADVYSLSVRADTLKPFGQKNQDSLARYYNEIFAHYNVTYDQFRSTMQWYKEHPPELDTVYTNVLNRLSAAEEKYKYTTPKPVPDAPPPASTPPAQ